MGGTDGEIRIKTELDNAGFQKDSKELERAIKSLNTKVENLRPTLTKAISGSANSMTTFQSKAKALESTISEIEQKMKQLGARAVPTDSYTDIAAGVDKAGQKLEALLNKQDRWTAIGKSQNGDGWKALQYDLEQASQEYDRLLAKREEMENSGEAYQSGVDTAEYAELSDRLSEAKDKLSELKAKIDETNGDTVAPQVDSSQVDSAEGKVSELKSEIDQVNADTVTPQVNDAQTGNVIQELLQLRREAQNTSSAGSGIKSAFSTAFSAVKSAASSATSSLGQMESGVKKIGSGLKSVASKAARAAAFLLGLKKSSDSTKSSFAGGLKTLLKYGLGIRSLYVLTNKLRSALTEGFQNLAQYSSSTNAAISSVSSALATLKNSLATAFNPILTVVAPIITTFINLLSTAVTYIGMFFAALSGGTSFTKALAVQKDYAASLSNTADAASAAGSAAAEAKKELYSFDDLNVISDDSSGSSGGGGGGGGSGTGTDTGNMFEEVQIPDSLLEMANKVKDALSDIWDVFKQGWALKGADTVESAKNALNSIVGVIGSIGSAFSTAWTGGAGLEVVTSLLNTFININNLIATIGDSFSRVFSNGVGVSIWENILGIIKGVSDTIGNLALQIQTAWNTAGLGDSIWSGILNIVDNVLTTVNNITNSAAQWASKLDFTPLLTSVSGLLAALEPLSADVGSGLEYLWNNVLLPIAGWAIEDGLPTFLDTLSAAVTLLKTALEKLQPAAQWIMDNVLTPLANFAWNTISSGLETIQSVLQKLNDLLEGNTTFSDFIDGLSPWETVLTSLAIAVGVVTAAVAAWTIATAAFNVVGAVCAGVIAALTSPIGIAVGVITALVAGFILLYQHCDTFREAIDNLIEKAKELLPGIKQGIEEGWETFTSWLSGLWQKIVDGFCNFFGIHSPSTVMADQGGYLTEGLFNGISNTWSTITDFFSTAVSGITDTLSTAWETIKSTASEKWSSIKDGISEKWDALKSSATETFESIKSGISEKWETIKSNASETWESVKSTISEKWDAIKSNVSETLDTVKSTVSDAWDNVKTSVSTKLSAAKDKASSLWDSIKSKASTVSNTVKSAASTAWGNVKDSISTKLSGAKSAATTAWNSIKSTATTTGSNVASSVSTSWTTVKKSISDNLDAAKSNASTAWGAIQSTASAKLSETKSAISTTFDSIKDTVSTKADAIKAAASTGFSNIKNAMTDRMSTAMSDIKSMDWKSIGTNICSGISNGIAAGWNWVVGKAKSIAQAALSAAKSALDINSPSRKFRDEVGYMAGLGMAIGFENSMPEVMDTVSTVADQVAQEAANSEATIPITASATDGLDEALGSFSDRVADSFSTLMNRLSAIAERVTFTVPAIATGTVAPQGVQLTAARSATQDQSGVDENRMRQIIREELSQRSSGGNDNHTWVLEGSMAALARVMRVYLEKEGQRQTVSLVEGG